MLIFMFPTFKFLKAMNDVADTREKVKIMKILAIKKVLEEKLAMALTTSKLNKLA